MNTTRETALNESILVVEDDEVLARTIARNLTARHYDVRACGSVAEALFSIDRRIPALLVLDIDLPDGSGWDVARKLRSCSQVVVPIIVVSALRPNERLVRELACMGFLEKPFPMEALTRKVEGLLRDRAVPDEETEHTLVEG